MNDIYPFKSDKKESPNVRADLKITSAPQQLEIYWHNLKTGSTAPRRSQICAAKIQDILPFIFLIDFALKQKPFLRFIGSSAKLHLAGLSFHNRPKSPIHTERNPTIKICLADLFLNSNPQKLYLHSNASSNLNKAMMSIGLFPLLDKGGKVTKAIGVVELKCT